MNRRSPSPGAAERLRQQYAAGETMTPGGLDLSRATPAAIALEFGLHRKTVVAIRHEFGVPTVPRNKGISNTTIAERTAELTADMPEGWKVATLRSSHAMFEDGL